MSAITPLSVILVAGRTLQPEHEYEPGRDRPVCYADLYVAGIVEHYGHYVQIYFGLDGGQPMPVTAGVVHN